MYHFEFYSEALVEMESGAQLTVLAAAGVAFGRAELDPDLQVWDLDKFALDHAVRAARARVKLSHVCFVCSKKGRAWAPWDLWTELPEELKGEGDLANFVRSMGDLGYEGYREAYQARLGEVSWSTLPLAIRRDIIVRGYGYV